MSKTTSKYVFSFLVLVFHLFLVPFEIWEEDKSNVWVWIFINDPVSLGLLLQDVVHPLKGRKVKLILDNVHSHICPTMQAGEISGH